MGVVTKKQFWAIKNALTNKEKDLIKFYELQWLLSMRVPTVDEVAKHIDQSLTSTNYYLQRAPVIKALQDRGIPFQQHTQEELTSTQIAAASVMMNFADERPASEKLDELGILPATYYAWLNDPKFNNLVEMMSQRNLGNIKPTAIAEYTKKIQSGDKTVLLHYMDNTGVVKSNDAPQSETLIRMLIEIIQKHVKDPELIMAIAQDIKLASANRTLEVAVQPAIESHVVSSESVLEARKKLGV